MSQGASNGGGQGAGNNRFVKFTRPAAQRIADAVRKVEGGNRDQGPVDLGPRFFGSTAKTFRVCTFTGSWDVGTPKTVTFKNQTSTPNTVSATNLFWPVPNGDQRDCAIAKDGTAWYLLVPQLYAAQAATAATLTTSTLEFQTLPVVALATASTVVFSVTPKTTYPITDVTLTGEQLEFTRKSVGVFFENTATTVAITITTCSTSTATG